ncbi:MAG: helix-turn-helix domain-containing protein [Actinomycetota bacterium]
MLAEDRTRAGWSAEQTARRLGVTQAIYREIEAGTRSPACGSNRLDSPAPRVHGTSVLPSIW